MPRTSKKKSNKNNARKNVKEAVEKLPGLIFHHRDTPQHTQAHHEEINERDQYTTHNPHAHYSFHTNTTHQKQLLVVLGTAVLGILIFGMWFLNVKASINNLHTNIGAEKELWDEAQQEVDVIFAQFDAFRASQVDRLEQVAENTQIAATEPTDKIKAVLSETFTNVATENATSSTQSE